MRVLQRVEKNEAGLATGVEVLSGLCLGWPRGPRSTNI